MLRGLDVLPISKSKRKSKKGVVQSSGPRNHHLEGSYKETQIYGSNLSRHGCIERSTVASLATVKCKERLHPSYIINHDQHVCKSSRCQSRTAFGSCPVPFRGEAHLSRSKPLKQHTCATFFDVKLAFRMAGARNWRRCEIRGRCGVFVTRWGANA